MAVAPEHPLVTLYSEEHNVPVEWPSESQEGWRGEDAKQPILFKPMLSGPNKASK